MVVVNKEICRNFIAKKKWQETLCILCNVKKRSECENLKAIREQEEREYEETHRKFEEKHEPVGAAQEDINNPYDYR